MKWFGAKTLYRTTMKGKPTRRDARYLKDRALVEERIVVFRARSFADAIRKAEKEAREYAGAPAHTNPYGQRVVTRYLECCDVFHMFTSPASGREIYSRTEVVTEPASRTITRLLGSAREPAHARVQFEIAGL